MTDVDRLIMLAVVDSLGICFKPEDWNYEFRRGVKQTTTTDGQVSSKKKIKFLQSIVLLRLAIIVDPTIDIADWLTRNSLAVSLDVAETK